MISCATAWMQSDFDWHINVHKGAAITINVILIFLLWSISMWARFESRLVPAPFRFPMAERRSIGRWTREFQLSCSLAGAPISRRKLPQQQQQWSQQNIRSFQHDPVCLNARRLAARDNWPPISWVDWPPNVGQLAASLIVWTASTEDDQRRSKLKHIASGIIDIGMIGLFFYLPVHNFVLDSIVFIPCLSQ